MGFTMYWTFSASISGRCAGLLVQFRQEIIAARLHGSSQEPINHCLRDRCNVLVGVPAQLTRNPVDPSDRLGRVRATAGA